jgi:hypothetical protein
MTVNDELERIRRSPSRKRRCAAIKTTESSLIKAPRNNVMN